MDTKKIILLLEKGYKSLAENKIRLHFICDFKEEGPYFPEN